MILTCGITHTDRRVEAYIQAERHAQGFTCDAGCGRSLDLTSALDQMVTYRCVECGRWLCKPCIVKHFAETGDDERGPLDATGGEG